jgi:cysteine desulfurase
VSIYLDHNAATPPDPAVIDAVALVMTETWGNPSTLYHSGQRAHVLLAQARARVARAIGADDPAEVIFTSGGTESDHLALTGVCLAAKERGNQLITSMVEHKAILRTCAQLERLGIQVTYLPVDTLGRVDPEAILRALTPKTLLVSLMLANNEVGSINAIRDELQ